MSCGWFCKRLQIDVISEKIKKGRQVGIADSFCVGLIAAGKTVQKGKDNIGDNLINLKSTEILTETIYLHRRIDVFKFLL